MMYMMNGDKAPYTKNLYEINIIQITRDNVYEHRPQYKMNMRLGFIAKKHIAYTPCIKILIVLKRCTNIKLTQEEKS